MEVSVEGRLKLGEYITDQNIAVYGFQNGAPSVG